MGGETMKGLVSINGEIVGAHKAHISVFDRGFLFGDSVYEVTHTYGRRIFLWKERWERMQHSARCIGISLPWDEGRFLAETLRVLKALDVEDAYIRWVVTRGEGEIGLDPSLGGRGNVVIFVRPFEGNPSWWYGKGVSLLISGVQRNAVDALDPNIKSGNYLNNMMAFKEALEKGFFDAIMLNAQGAVTEGTTFNVWVVQGETILTPPPESGLLLGIIRQKLGALIREGEAFELREQSLRPEDIFKARECFITSSSKELVPVTAVDGHKIGDGRPGPVYQKLHTQFQKWRDRRLKEDDLAY
ncbi:MAG: aminotransferase class IV [Bacteriovoracales bacterium]|nr:aminotransferase class IV [Bacteriovoracales bacterium]